MKKLGAFTAIYLCWGATFLAIRYVVAEVPPLLAIAIRCAGGAVVLLAWLAWRRRLEPTTASQWRTAAISGLFLFLGCHGLLAWVEQRVSSGEAALLLTSIPLWLVTLDAIRVRAWPPPSVVLGLLLGVSGVAVLSWGGEGSTGSLMDRALLVLSGLSWAIGSLIGRHGPKPTGAAQTTAMQLLGGAAILLLLSPLLGEWGRLDLAAISDRGIWSMAFLIVGGTVIGFGAYTWLLGVSSPSAVGTYAFVNPVVALLLAWLTGDGTITGRSLVAMVLVLLAVIFSREPSVRKNDRREPVDSRLSPVASRT